MVLVNDYGEVMDALHAVGADMRIMRRPVEMDAELMSFLHSGYDTVGHLGDWDRRALERPPAPA